MSLGPSELKEDLAGLNPGVSGGSEGETSPGGEEEEGMGKSNMAPGLEADSSEKEFDPKFATTLAELIEWFNDREKERVGHETHGVNLLDRRADAPFSCVM